MHSLNLNTLSQEMMEALLKELKLFTDEYNLGEVIFTGEITEPLLAQAQSNRRAPIPASVRREKRPDFLPGGWWVDYRVRHESKYIYKNYVDPVSGRKFRSKDEVERYLWPGIIWKKGNASTASATPEWPTWGRNQERSEGDEGLGTSVRISYEEGSSSGMK